MNAPAPRRSLILWMSQRVGSTMLARALRGTGLVGHPEEWLNAEDGDALMREHRVTDVHALRDKLWTDAVTPNGVLGLKHGFVAYRDASFTRLFRGLVDEPEPTHRAAWEAMFPRPAHVFMTRRDKVRLAVSWWRAICVGTHAHRPVGEPELERPADDAYKYEAIKHLTLEVCLREAAMQQVFSAWGVVPLTLVYEDMVADYEATVRRVLAFVGERAAATTDVPAPAYEQLADELNEAWVQRFREEAQRDWPNRIW